MESGLYFVRSWKYSAMESEGLIIFQLGSHEILSRILTQESKERISDFPEHSKFLVDSIRLPTARRPSMKHSQTNNGIPSVPW